MRTVWHELLHYGLRRFLTKGQYIAKLNDLYQQDAWIKHQADAWLGSANGQSIAENDGKAYARARGVDEALAELAETSLGEYQNSGVVAKAIRAVSNWVSDMAERFGFGEAAARWRSASNVEARQLVQAIFKKLRDDAPATSSDWAFTSDPAFMTAYHGSPHDHDGFSTAHIGSGEGAQSYGWGLYFAGAKKVAEWYRNNLSKNTPAHNTLDGQRITQKMLDELQHSRDYAVNYFFNSPSGRRASSAARLGPAVDEYIADAKESLKDYQGRLARALQSTVVSSTYSVEDYREWVAVAERKITSLEQLKSRMDYVEKASRGKLYAVELAPTENDYLDWDKPLSEQSDVVKKALEGSVHKVVGAAIQLAAERKPSSLKCSSTCRNSICPPKRNRS